MGISAALTIDIADLCRGIGSEPDTVTGPLTALSRDLTRAVDSYVGLQARLPDYGHPVTLTSFAPSTTLADIATSLRLPLPALLPGEILGDGESAVVFYARRAGAFVDLAADFSSALTLPDPWTSRDADPAGVDPRRIRLDEDLRPSTFEPGLSGTADVSALNRAVGYLMAEGHGLEDAHEELVRRAAAAGITVLEYAIQLIRPGLASP